MSTSAQSTIQIAMATTNRLFETEVFKQRNFDALDQIYTATARILPPGAPMISGREGIKKFWADFVETVNATSAILESVDVTVAGDQAVEIGTATLTIQPEGPPSSQVQVKYVVHWKQEDGHWRWNTDIWNTNS